METSRSRPRYSPQSGVAIGMTSSRSFLRLKSVSMQMAHDASSSRSDGMVGGGVT